jgi:t-SNARE complex subunit (syntaxin)
MFVVLAMINSVAALEVSAVGRRAVLTGVAAAACVSPRPSFAARSAAAEANARKRELEKIEERVASGALEIDKVLDRAERNQLVDPRMLPE